MDKKGRKGSYWLGNQPCLPKYSINRPTFSLVKAHECSLHTSGLSWQNRSGSSEPRGAQERVSGTSHTSLGGPAKPASGSSATDTTSRKSAQWPHRTFMAERPLLSPLFATCHLASWDQGPETLPRLPPENRCPQTCPLRELCSRPWARLRRVPRGDPCGCRTAASWLQDSWGMPAYTLQPL